MTVQHISISEAARRYGVDRRTIQRKIAKGELERIELKNGHVGVTVHSLQAAYGLADAVDAESDPPQRQGATNATLPHAATAASAARRDAAPDEVAELLQRLAAAEAKNEALAATLEHERTDRISERKAWSAKFDLLAKSLITTKGADAVRDMAEIKRLQEKGVITESEAAPTDRPAPGGLWGLRGLLTRWRKD